MGKNLVLCCDGTANEFAANLTNVVKLYSTLVNSPESQVTYYHPGLGTMEPAGALTTFSRKTTKLLGMAVGYGLSNDIRDAYVFLMRNFSPEDRLYLFGFSRGAYTAKAICSLLHMYGLLRRDNEAMVPYAIRLMMSVDRAVPANQSHQQALAEYFGLAQDFKTTLSTPCKPWFVGLWDTVSSVGWIENPLKLPYVANNPDIQIGRHAVAMDERRAFFRTHLWRPPAGEKAERGPRDLKQVWFPGVHCDVGGGYPESESGLSKYALDWMLEEGTQVGLLVDNAKVAEVLGQGSAKHIGPDPDAQLHESLTGWWNLAEFIPKKHFDSATGETHRKMNLWSRRAIPAGGLVHESAFLRKGYQNRIPKDAVMVKTR